MVAASSVTPCLSIVIPTFNGRRVLEPCLHSVQRHRPANTEILVVDDASTDGTAEWLRATHPDVQLIRLHRNHGFCGAINAGLRAAKAPIIETLNNDTVVTAGWADAAMSLFADPTVGSVAPLVFLLREYGLVDSAGDEYQISGWAMNRGHRRRLDPSLLHVAEVFGASACAAFYRREALLRAGLFPEHFRAYYDDVDLAFRLRAAGYRCLYTPRARVLHHHNYSHNHDTPEMVARLACNEERVYWANVPGSLLLRSLLPHFVYIGGVFASRWLRGDNAWPYLRGKVAILQEWGRIEQQRRLMQRLQREAEFPSLLPVDTDLTPLVERVQNKFRPAWAFAVRHGRAGACRLRGWIGRLRQRLIVPVIVSSKVSRRAA
jgi:GT2 family glycosyltransferase